MYCSAEKQHKIFFKMRRDTSSQIKSTHRKTGWFQNVNGFKKKSAENAAVLSFSALLLCARAWTPSMNMSPSNGCRLFGVTKSI